MGVELDPAGHRPHHGDGLVEDLQSARPEHRSGGRDAFVVERHVEVLVGEDRRRAAARRPELQLALPPDAARHLEELAHGDAVRRLVLTRACHVTGQAEEPDALGLLGAERREPVRAVLEDGCDLRDRLHVVDRGRAGIQARDRRERRTQPRLAAAPLEGVQPGRLLAADVGARAGVHRDVEVEAAAEDVLAEVARLVRLLHRVQQPPVNMDDLAPQVDERVVAVDREAGDDHALEQDVRGVHHQGDVLAGPRLGLVGVDHEVARLAVVGGQEAPLHPGREARAATTAQPGVLGGLHEVGPIGGQHLAECLVAVVLEVGLQREGLRRIPERGQDRRQLRHHLTFPSVAAPVACGGRGARASFGASQPRSRA